MNRTLSFREGTIALDRIAVRLPPPISLRPRAYPHCFAGYFEEKSRIKPTVRTLKTHSKGSLLVEFRSVLRTADLSLLFELVYNKSINIKYLQPYFSVSD